MTTIDLRPTFGDYVRKARKEAGLTQEAVAEALGVSQARVSRWESGDDTPRIKEYLEFVRITGVSVDLQELLITCYEEAAA
jgi:transcriptional regulator with XRE-family HTH domain